MVSTPSSASSTPIAAPRESGPILEVEHLRALLPTARGTVHAVDGVNLTIERGERLGLVGESGSGKSVLSRTVMQLLPRTAQTEGAVRFEGREVSSHQHGDESGPVWGKDISMVFQNPAAALSPVMRVGRPIIETLRQHLGLDRSAAKARAVELFDRVGIAEPERRLRNYPHEFSGGMLQRVCIALAVACSPRLLFADEPTTALDVTTQHHILELMHELQRENHMAMVLITHDLGVVAHHVDRVAVMYAGQILELAPTRDLFQNTRHPYSASLMAAIPRLENPSHTRLTSIPGRPADVVNPSVGCRFAPRCALAQPKCLVEDPQRLPEHAPGHRVACFFPVGTDAGRAAERSNREAGRTAAGLDLGLTSTGVSA